MRIFDYEKIRIFDLGKYEAQMEMMENGYYDTIITDKQTGKEMRKGCFLNETEAFEEILSYFEIYSDDDPNVI